jgi:hypothetical protein
MSIIVALASAAAAIDQVPDGGLANGATYANASMPSTSHIAAVLKWPVKNDGSNAALVTHICAYSKAHLDSAGRSAATEKVDIDTAVIVAIARCAAWRFFSLDLVALNPVEVAQAAANAPDLSVHTDHEAEVVAALETWTASATRYMALAVYNAISYETSNHHHLPSATKKLATTTMTMTGLTDWVAAAAPRESWVFHDMFHPLSDVTKSNLARDSRSGPMLSSVKFDNLRKRVPVKAPDSGLAINYPTLFARARSYRHTPAHLPDALEPPASVFDAIADYNAASTAADLMAAVDRLRKMSEALAEPSAYLAGFILGREAAAAGDPDLTLRLARRDVTILGSPAYARVAGEHSGTFNAGKASGLLTVASTVADQVLPRVETGVAAAESL